MGRWEMGNGKWEAVSPESRRDDPKVAGRWSEAEPPDPRHGRMRPGGGARSAANRWCRYQRYRSSNSTSPFFNMAVYSS